MKLLRIIKKEKIKFEAYIFNNGFIDIKKSHPRYDLMVKDILKNNFKNKYLVNKIEEVLSCGTKYEREIYKEKGLEGKTPLEQLESFFKQFNDLYEYEFIEEAMYKYLIGKTTTVDKAVEFYQYDYNTIKYPIDVERFIKDIGIKLIKAPDFKNMDKLGKAELINNIPTISINILNNQHIGRRRFTISHELGHILQHILPKVDLSKPVNNIEFDDTKATMAHYRSDHWDSLEMEANQFAANFLMPEELIHHEYQICINNNLNQDKIITEMAEIFKVSRASIRIRLESLGIIQ